MTTPGHDYSWEPENEARAMAMVDAELEAEEEARKARSWREDCASSVGFERDGSRLVGVRVYPGIARFQAALASMLEARFLLCGYETERTEDGQCIVVTIRSYRRPVIASVVVTETRTAIRECHRLFRA